MSGQPCASGRRTCRAGAVQITRFGGPEGLDVVDVPEPEAGDGQKLYDVSTAGIDVADTQPNTTVGHDILQIGWDSKPADPIRGISWISNR